ncbi:MAG: MgtC/SapB family protein [Rhodobacteraceae bacterium]|jgi:putative Mg2+ transporter-C (MgtC) family protein|nr:MgtC/SapB family protein [Alphaproteobacteria bacterium]NNK66624.1 MgtC/SapB family protein [Paracoccaceae bacterium]
MGVDQTEFIFRVLIAAGCGLLVGIDREIKNKPLGARTYILVAAACAAWAMLTINFAIQSAQSFPDLNADPTRLIQGLVGAIGFLGAGAIISTSEEGRLRGVASGAAIWGVGAVGVACGLGYFIEALVLSALFFVVLNAYDFLADRVDREK